MNIKISVLGETCKQNEKPRSKKLKNIPVLETCMTFETSVSTYWSTTSRNLKWILTIRSGLLPALSIKITDTRTAGICRRFSIGIYMKNLMEKSLNLLAVYKSQIVPE